MEEKMSDRMNDRVWEVLECLNELVEAYEALKENISIQIEEGYSPKDTEEVANRADAATENAKVLLMKMGYIEGGTECIN